jgi:hypothetical protein
MNGFYVSFWELLSCRKICTPHYTVRGEKLILGNCLPRVLKERQSCADSKKVQNPSVEQKGKFLYKKNIFKDIKKFSKNHFFGKESLDTSWRKSYVPF